MTTNQQQQDFSELLALPEFSLDESENAVPDTTGFPSQGCLPNACPSHPGNDCLCHGFMTEFDFQQTPAQVPAVSNSNIPEPDYAAFENWIPRFVRPAKPCDYCHFKRLDCYLGTGSDGSCAPCKSLFRECSLTNSLTLESVNYADKPHGEFLDTLHSLDENTAREFGTLTGIKELRSKTQGSGTTTPVRADDAPGSLKRNGIRFPRAAIKVLKDWLDVHQDHPYPSEEEKAELERQTELSATQIANWLANARRRRKVVSRSRPKIASSPSLRPTTPAMAIPHAEKPWDELNPLERWQHSPPANEPAAITDIANAVAHTEFDEEHEPTSPSSYGRQKGSSSSFSGHRAPSTTSIEASSNSLSGISSGANSSHGSFGSFSSSLAGKKAHRRRRRQAAAPLRAPHDDKKKRMFQCTFCTDTFKSKYDWTRHEKSLHLSLEKWMCAPLGPKLTDPATGAVKCAYCTTENPTDEHIETHNHTQCEEKGADARIFFRKDHLRQHLRLMHGCEMKPCMDAWRTVASQINSRCGFCAQRFTVWQERVDHLTIHFKAGARMSEWRGCRGLDPAVAAQVTNAMPPYLIGMESLSPDPFSATRSSTHLNWMSAQGDDINNTLTPAQRQKIYEDATRGNKSTCWEILTVRLGKYANEMASKGIVMTDEMLQKQARLLLFDSEDPWNQTAADNPEWLDLFRKAHGLDFIPSDVGGQGRSVPTDLETYGDLGLRIPFVVQLQAFNEGLQQKGCRQHPHDTTDLNELHAQDMQQTQHVAQTFYRQLSESGLLHKGPGTCGHPECQRNTIDLNALEPSTHPLTNPHRWWCTHELPTDKAALLGIAAYKATQAGTLGCPQPLPTTSSRPTSSRHSSGSNAAQNKAHAFNNLSYLQEVQDSSTKTFPPQKNPYLPRHKYELPPERARKFASMTPAWQDAGMMPELMSTSALSPPHPAGGDSTTTGAMIEFLGGDVGADLAFCNDAATSVLQLPTSSSAEYNFPMEGTVEGCDPGLWNMGPGNSGSDQEVLRELDELIQRSSGEQLAAMVAEAPDGASGIGQWDRDGGAQMGGTMEEGDGEMEFNFDDMVFDMDDTPAQ